MIFFGDLFLVCIGIEWGSDWEGLVFDLNLYVFIILVRIEWIGGKFVNLFCCIGLVVIIVCRVVGG